MLTTSDNPYNPWTEWDKWFAWDHEHGYDTPAYVARFANTLSNMSDEDSERVYDEAVLAIVEQNMTGTYLVMPMPKDYVA